MQAPERRRKSADTASAATFAVIVMLKLIENSSTSIPGALSFDLLPRKVFHKGAIIKQPDDSSDSVYLIETGRVQTFYISPQGLDVVFSELNPGDFIGDLSAIDGDLPFAYFEAKEDTTTVVFRRSQFLGALRQSPQFAEVVAQTLCSRLRAINQLYLESRLLPMRTRLYTELIRLSSRDEAGALAISPAPTHSELARRIASQRETVTKQMSHLAKEGVIDGSRDRIRILNEGYFRTEITNILGTMNIR